MGGLDDRKSLPKSPWKLVEGRDKVEGPVFPFIRVAQTETEKEYRRKGSPTGIYK